MHVRDHRRSQSWSLGEATTRRTRRHPGFRPVIRQSSSPGRDATPRSRGAGPEPADPRDGRSPGAGTPDHGRPPRTHRLQAGTAIPWPQGSSASDPFSRQAQHGRSRPRGCAASGCNGSRHHAGLLPRADGTLRSSPGSQRSAVQKREEIEHIQATLTLTHKAIGAEVRRGPYDVVVDGERAGSVEMNRTIEIPVEPGRHTLQVRNGRNSSSTQTFDARRGQIVAFRCTGKRLLPDLSRILCRAQAGTETRSRLSRRREVSSPGKVPGPIPRRPVQRRTRLADPRQRRTSPGGEFRTSTAGGHRGSADSAATVCSARRRLARWMAIPWSRARRGWRPGTSAAAAYCFSRAVSTASVSARLCKNVSTSSGGSTRSIITKRMRCRPRSG